MSVVIPTTRLDAHFRTALDSILRQTLEDIEVVVVLDGISDDRWTPADPRVRVLRHAERLGTPRSLNDGIVAASAPLIARLDADDVAHPDRLAHQVEAFTARQELVALGTGARVVDAAGTPFGAIAAVSGFPASALLRRNLLVHSSTMYRRKDVLAVGGYDGRCDRMQDYDLWLRLCRRGVLDNLSEILVDYRVHGGMHSRVTPAFGAAARRVRASRLELARHLGRTLSAQRLENAVWTGWQVLRHAGLRRPRYLTLASGSSRAQPAPPRRRTSLGRRGTLFVTTTDVSLDLVVGGQLARLRDSAAAPVSAAAGDTGRLVAVGRREGVAVHSVPLVRAPSPLRDLVGLVALLRLLARTRPALVVYGTPKAAVLTAVAARVTGVPNRLHILHGLRLETTTGLTRRVLTALERLTIRLSTTTVAVSHSLRARCAEVGFDTGRMRVLGPGAFVGVDVARHRGIGADPGVRAAVRARFGIPVGVDVIGFVGRLTRDKGIEELLRAVDALRVHRPLVRLVLVGPDEGTSALSDRSRRLIASPWVTITGEVRDPAELYAAFDVFAFPTHREGLGTALLEAAATGVPIVAASATGVIDVVTHGRTGLLVPVGDERALLDALLRVLSEPGLRDVLVAGARHRVAEDFPREAVWLRHRHFYESLVLTRPTGGTEKTFPNGDTR